MLQENHEEESLAAYLAAEVEATNGLIADFNVHADAFEAMEVGICHLSSAPAPMNLPLPSQTDHALTALHVRMPTASAFAFMLLQAIMIIWQPMDRVGFASVLMAGKGYVGD